MPRKIRELKADLRKAGFTIERSRGSHDTWKHPLSPDAVVLSGNDGDDARPYQEKSVGAALRKLREIQEKSR